AGWSLHEALEKQPRTFPPLFRALAAVGEETGNLPEVMGELEKYYTNQQKLRHDFIADITWPVMQFVVATLIVAGLILLLGFIQQPDIPGRTPIDPLGLGLLGVEGALTFLGVVAGGVAALWLLFALAAALLYRVPRLQRLAFRIPVLGPCLRALALTR